MQDLRDAIRALRASPLVSSVAVLSLALGMGANTALFSILDGLLLKPLPVREPERLVSLASGQSGEDAALSYPVWQQLRDRHVLGDAFVWATDKVNISDGGEVTAANAVWASGGFFDTLGVGAIAGRTFGTADDKRDGGPDGPVAVIGYGFWQRRFGGAPDAVGRTLTIDRVPFTVVGVTSSSFFGLSIGDSFDVILPLETEPLLGRRPARIESSRWPWLHVLGRVRQGQTVDTLTALVRVAQPQIRASTMPDFARAEDRDAYLRAQWTVRSAATGTSSLRVRYGPALVTLLVIVGFVLLVACANIANLQLARTTARRHELSVRVALGASRLRIVRLMLVESLLLALSGTVLGFAFAQWGSRFVVAQLSTWYSTAFLDLSPDLRVLGVTAAVAVVTAILFGTAPAVRATRADPMDALKERRRLTPGGRLGVGGALVIGQIALSLLLIVGAGVFVRSFAALAYRDLGFDRSRLLVAVVDARRTTIPPAARGALLDRLREAAGAVPGVESAASSMATPMGNAGVRFTWEVAPPGIGTFNGHEPRILTTPVSPGWFRTFGTRLLAGRDFDDRDVSASAGVVIINEAFARGHFGAANPLGRTILVRPGRDEPRSLEIVGLVQDAAFTTIREPVAPTIYTPLSQSVDEKLLTSIPTISVSVRAMKGMSSSALTPGIAAAIKGVDRDLAVSFVAVADQLSANYVRERLLALLSGFFGALALLLAALGLYGVTAHAVSRRRTEIGIRMALGADARGIVRAVLGRVALLSVAGIVAGVIATLWASRLVQGLVFGTSPRDPLIIAGSAAVLALVAGAAGWQPARAAARIDPAVVLREDAS